MWGTAVRIALVAVDAFVALTAIGGGLALAFGLETRRLPVEWLKRSPFHSYRIPGLILAVVVGGGAAVATVAALRGAYVGGLASILAGALLMGQILGEMVVLDQPDQPSGIEIFYFAVGLLMTALGFLATMIGRVW